MKTLIFMISMAFSTILFSQEKDIKLPKPDTTGGKPLMSVLKNRSTNRNFGSEKLSLNQISDLCWAAFGINRCESGKRTAPSAMNWQEIDLYITMDSAIYIYDAVNHALKFLKKGDYRKWMGKQDFVKDATLCFIYVADYTKMNGADEKDKEKYSFVDVGFISQNVYLYCSSNNLSTVILGYIDRDAISNILALRKSQKVIFSQPVGNSKGEAE